MIQFNCPKCKHGIEVDDIAGCQKATCPSCKEVVDVPAPNYLPALECPHCKTEHDLDNSWAGKMYKCPKCHMTFRVPDLEGQGGGGCLGVVAFVGVTGLGFLTYMLTS